MKIVNKVLAALWAFCWTSGCVSPKLVEPAHLSHEDDHYTEELPRIDGFRLMAQQITEVRINYWFPNDERVTQVLSSQEIAEVKKLLLSPDISPHPSSLGLGGEPYLSAFNHGKHLFDVRWQYEDRIRIFSGQSYDWLGTYSVTASWRQRYIAICSRGLQKTDEKKPDSASRGNGHL